MKDWHKVFVANNQFQVELIKNELISNEINAVIIDKKSSPYQLGNLEIYVPEKDAIVSKTIIDLFLKNETE
jgi:Putative prokaryotic signal transducing protein